jgi:hypothetical protein
MNFTVPDGIELQTGSYVDVRVTTSFSNSLVGEMVGSGDLAIGSAGDRTSGRQTPGDQASGHLAV